MIALAFGGDAQPEAIRATALSAVNVQDFDAALLPRTREGQPIVMLQQVWRYGATAGGWNSRSRRDARGARDEPAGGVARRRSDADGCRSARGDHARGTFQAELHPARRLEVESLSGAALSQWTEAQEGSQRIVTLHFNGRTIGEQAFNLSLAGPRTRRRTRGRFPRLVVREATRQTGDVLVVPGKGIRLRAVDREKVTQLDPRTVGGQQPGHSRFACCRKTGCSARNRNARGLGDVQVAAGGDAARRTDAHPHRAALPCGERRGEARRR
jgi:hypothetical protein